MDARMLDRRIDALLDDPLVSLMIQADRVDRAGLARQLRGLGDSAVGRRASDKTPRGLWRRIAPLACGACAP
jgi:hypothetical protein